MYWDFPNEELFIVEIRGIGLGMQSKYYDLSASNYRMAVIDKYGHFIIKPFFNKISFDKHKQIFIVDINRTVKRPFYNYRGVRQ